MKWPIFLRHTNTNFWLFKYFIEYLIQIFRYKIVIQFCVPNKLVESPLRITGRDINFTSRNFPVIKGACKFFLVFSSSV